MNKYKVFYSISNFNGPALTHTEIRATDYAVKDGFLVFTKRDKQERQFDDTTDNWWIPTVTKTVATFRDWSRVELVE